MMKSGGMLLRVGMGEYMNFKQEYLCQWIEEENSFFKIQHRLAAIDYILETEEYDDAIDYLDRSGSIQNATRIKNRIKETHDWKTVWEFVLKYKGWTLGDLKEEKRRWAELK